MLKRIFFSTLLVLTPLALAIAGECNFDVKSLSKEMGFDSANLDLGDRELAFKVFHPNKDLRMHEHGEYEDHFYDYIIVGNGTAGATLANKLTTNSKAKVLVIEAGANRSTDPVVNTASFDLNAITYDPRYAVTYTTPPFTSAGQVFTYTEGRMWGGGSGHHYLNYVRGSPVIYDAWATASGNSQWAYNNLLPTLKNLETYTPNGTTPNPAERGTTGPIYSTQQASAASNPWAAAIQSAFGIPYVLDYNDSTQSSVGVSARQLFVTPDNTTRSWAVPAFLTLGVVVDENGNGLGGRRLKIISNSLVNNIIWNGNTAIGVEFIQAGDDQRSVKVYAKKQIILAAGAVNSPAILERSGVGDPAVLNALGIPVVLANTNVGANMKNHYGTIAYVEGSTPQVLIAFTDMYPYMPNDGTRRYQFFAQNVGNQVRIQGWNLNPQSTGNVHIVNRSALTQPKINFNFYSDGAYGDSGSDANLAISFFKLVADTATAMSATVTNPSPTQYSSDALLFAAAQGATATPVSSTEPILGNFLNVVITNHMVGTTKMGTSTSNGVVDGNLNVMGVNRLKIIDIGVAPQIPDGNTCVSAYALGEKAYDIIIAGN